MAINPIVQQAAANRVASGASSINTAQQGTVKPFVVAPNVPKTSPVPPQIKSAIVAPAPNNPQTQTPQLPTGFVPGQGQAGSSDGSIPSATYTPTNQNDLNNILQSAQYSTDPYAQNTAAQIQQNWLKSQGANTPPTSVTTQQGQTVNNLPTSATEEENNQSALNEEQTSQLDQQISYGKQKASEEAGTQESAVQAGIGSVSREGITSPGNQMSSNTFVSSLQASLQNAQAQFAKQQQDLSEAQANGDATLANNIESKMQDQQAQIISRQLQLQDFQKGQVDIISSMVNSNQLVGASDAQLQDYAQRYGLDYTALKVASQSNTATYQSGQDTASTARVKTANDMLLSAAQDGAQISDSMVNTYASALGVDPSKVKAIADAYNLSVSPEALQKAKLANQNQQVTIAQANQNLSDQLNGLGGSAGQTTRLLDYLHQSGAPQDMIDIATQASGLNNYNDPETKAKLALDQAQGVYETALANNESGTVGTPGYWNMKKAQADYQVALGTYQQTYGVNPDGSALGGSGGSLVSGTPDASRNILGYDFTNYAYSGNPNKPVDPAWSNGVNSAISKIGSSPTAQSLQTWISQTYPKSQITGQEIMDAANTYKVPPELIAGIAAHESSMGTAGAGAKTFNPGNVGNTNSGATSDKGTWQGGLNALAENISQRQIGNGGSGTAFAGDVQSKTVGPNTPGQAVLTLPQIYKMPNADLSSGLTSGEYQMPTTPTLYKALSDKLGVVAVNDIQAGLARPQITSLSSPIVAGGYDMNHYVKGSVSQVSGTHYLDTTTISNPAEKTSAENAARELGVPIIGDPKDKQTIQTLNAGWASLQSYDNALNAINGSLSQDDYQRLLNVPLNQLAAFTQQNPQLAALSVYKLNQPELVKAVTGMTRVNATLLGIAGNVLPSENDTVQTIKDKMDALNDIFTSNEQSILGTGDNSSASTGSSGNLFTNIGKAITGNQSQGSGDWSSYNNKLNSTNAKSANY